jgi:hypothetical protein
MIPVGFMSKTVYETPDWLKTANVRDIYSVSGCISEEFCDYTKFWKHNGYWLFDSPAAIDEIATAESVDLSARKLFYFEAYEQQFDERSKTWRSFAPVAGLATQVQPPIKKTLQGFDVVSFMAQNGHECSPLSCNHLAETIAVNSHCLLESLAEAKELLEHGAFVKCEPGPYRIYAVYTCDAA